MNAILQCLLNIGVFAKELTANYGLIKQQPTSNDNKFNMNECLYKYFNSFFIYYKKI